MSNRQAAIVISAIVNAISNCIHSAAIAESSGTKNNVLLVTDSEIPVSEKRFRGPAQTGRKYAFADAKAVAEFFTGNVNDDA